MGASPRRAADVKSVSQPRGGSALYDSLGVRTIVNAKGTSTRVSGGIMRPETAAAMYEASQSCVDMIELQARASEIIAGITGAQAGLVTAGAAAGLLLGTAACVSGLDPARMNRLPDTRGMKNEVIIARSQRNGYDHAIRAAGVQLVEVGIADRVSGAGVRDAEPWQYADAIGERTAAIAYVAHANSLPPLPDVVDVAHRAGVPVLVDAAAQLPPVENLRRFVADGADLVVFSGGKAIGGPQSSGMLCGRRELIAAAALQWMDADIDFEQWNPPASFIDKKAIVGLPQHGIGRPCKVGKEEIAGLLTALRLFVDDDPARRRRGWDDIARALCAALENLPHCAVAIVAPEDRFGMPTVRVTLDEAAAGLTARELVRKLQDGAPSIHVDSSRVAQATVAFAPIALRADEPAVIGRRLRELLGASAPA
jgi:L-seryl-tRNA(Ser) seleniumtransferase